MRKAEIRVGGKYLIGGHRYGPAVVLEEPTKDPYRSRAYQARIHYPEMPPHLKDYRGGEQTISLADFIKPWDDEDQEKFKNINQDIEDKQGWESALADAGYSGGVRVVKGAIYHLVFRGVDAERVISALTGEYIEPLKKEEDNG